MTIKVDKQMRERIDAKKIDMKKSNYIYESPDGGKTIYRSEIYDDVSGVKIDKPNQLELEFDEFKADPQYQAGYSDAMAYAEEDKRAISLLAKRVLELEKVIDKIKTLVK